MKQGSGRELRQMIREILLGGTHFLSGIHIPSPGLPQLLKAVSTWTDHIDRSLEEVAAVIEPCLRQSILMSLLPASALDPAQTVNIDQAIADHLEHLHLNLPADEREILRDICINYRKLIGLDRRKARSLSYSIGDLKADRSEYNRIRGLQGGRCFWCGVELRPPTYETIEHVAPKHLGDDAVDGRNWAIACKTCNEGKSDALAWSAMPEAHDFITRDQVVSAHIIAKPHRWSVLARCRKCQFCNKGVDAVELKVYRRVSTGLPIPSNCAATCVSCAASHVLDVLGSDWAKEEQSRQ